MEEIWKRLVYPEFTKDNHFMISSYGRLKNEETGKTITLRSPYLSSLSTCSGLFVLFSHLGKSFG